MIGLGAGVLTTSCWAPQIVRSYRTRSTGDISWAYVAALGSGVVLWLSYGMITGDAALIVANVATIAALVSLALLKRHYDRPLERPPLDRIEAVLLDMDVVLARGARELLHRLAAAGLPWAVVTSADRRVAAARLDAAGVRPSVLVTVEDVAAGKPDPEGFLLAARRLGVPIGRCLVVEDSAPGAEAGHRAGAVVAGLRGLPADVPVADLADVAALLPAAA